MLPTVLQIAIWRGTVEYSGVHSASLEDGTFSLQPAFNSYLVDVTSKSETRKNAILTGQEYKGDIQIKTCELSFVLFCF